ncbi:MAG: glycoside hydrolase [Chloroflexi bacterium]|nr:glycoside hydrolase [Chloroflexota bacterium]
MQTIYLVPHTHYDVAWAFTKEEYLNINEIILEEALRMMENSDFKFCLEQTFLLKEIEKRNIGLAKGIEKMIKAGKLEIVDGQYLMPDTMLPTGEVLVRDILVGKRYCKVKFGIDVPVAWAADSFGMNTQLPQIYRKAGYKWLAFRRGARVDIKQSEFLWKGLDGTTILAHWMPLGYRAGLALDQWRQSFVELNKFAATRHILMPCGSGSMPPQSEIPQAVDNWNQTHPNIEMKMATPSEFFQALESSGKKFEVIEGELYDDELVDVFPQVCSSRIWIVQGSRECEGLIVTAEEFATIAWLLGAQYPTNEFREAWEKALFVAFHDIITGCGVDEIYGEVREILTALKTKLTEIINKSLSYITEKIATNGRGIVVFNPLPWQTRNWVKAAKGGFIADVPPLGYKVYKLPLLEPVNKIKVEGNQIETTFYRLKVDDKSGIVEVFDKTENLLLSGNELVIEDEVGDLYHHRSRFSPELIKSESGEGFQYGSFKPKSFRIEEESSKVKIIFENEYYCLTWPYRLKERFPPRLYKYKTLDIRKEVVVFRDIPRIEFTTRINNKYPNIRLRVKFDTGIERKIYFRETQFGVIPEPTECFIRGERTKACGIPNFMSWFDICDGIRGITFMNRGLPAVGIIEGSVYITLFRSVYGLSADGIAGPLVPTQDALELKSYTFEYAVQPHSGDWRQAEMYKLAQEFNHLPIAIQGDGKGDIAPEFSFLRISPNSLILSALKKAEDSDEVILRFFETKGEATEAEVELFREIKRLTLVDLLEREEKELPFMGNRFGLEVKPFEIVTLKLEF